MIVKMFLGCAVVSLALTAGAADARVEFKDCPKCECRFRIDTSANKAYVNKSRVAEKDLERVAARAVQYLDRARAPKDYDVSLCPLMGWSSWNSFGLDINEQLIVDVAKAMATNGLKAAGYLYVNTDDGFFNGHDETTGQLKWNLKRFPRGMKPVVDSIHAVGLKAGVYSDAGRDTCGSIWGGGNAEKQVGGSGLYGHDAADFKLHFVDIGADFIKVDYCGGLALKLDEHQRYAEIAAGIKATGRTDVRLNVCRWAYPGTWISEVAGSWRTTATSAPPGALSVTSSPRIFTSRRIARRDTTTTWTCWR